MTQRETFRNLSDVWAKESDLYSTNQACVKMLVGNKIDKVSSSISLLCFKVDPKKQMKHGQGNLTLMTT